MLQYAVFTIGHSNRTFQEFVYLLKLYRIRLLIDVRRYPKSKFVWFNKDELRDSLLKENIKYISFRELGALGIAKNIKPFDDITCIDSPTYKSYITYLIISDIARLCLERILGFIKNGEVCCIMCCEKFPWRCHRYYLSDVLTSLGIEVVHIIDEKRTMRHKGTRCYDYIRNKIKQYWMMNSH